MGNSLAVAKPKRRQHRRQPQPEDGDDDDDDLRLRQPQPQPQALCASAASRRKTLSPTSHPFCRPVGFPHPRPSPKRRTRSPRDGVTSDCSSTTTATTATTATTRATESHVTRRSIAAATGRECAQETRRTLHDRSPLAAMHALSAAASDGHRAVAGAPLAPLRQDDSINAIPSQAQAQPAAQDTARDEQQRRRVQQAETILLEIAKEFAAKRAAGLVPMKPVPARTLLWQELERRAQRVRSRVGRRGTCVFGRDTDSGPCGCSTYKTGNTGLDPGGGVCACCSHGAPWHRLSGGTMAATDSGSTTLSHSSRATARVSLRLRKGTGRSRASSRNSCYAAASRSASGEALQQTLVEGSVYSLGSDYYDEFDGEYSDEESEEEEDDDDVANEVARPHGMMMEDLAPPLVHSHARSEGDTSLDRSSLFSNGDSFGLPPRLSSTSRHLDKLLGAIAKYRTMGLSEAEIEVKLRRDFPPTERLSHDGKRSSSSLSSPSSSPSRPTRASQ